MIASMLKWGLIFGAFRGNRESGSAIGHLLIAILAPLIALIIRWQYQERENLKLIIQLLKLQKIPMV